MTKQLADELTALAEKAADKSTHMFKRMGARADLTGLVEDNLTEIIAALRARTTDNSELIERLGVRGAKEIAAAALLSACESDRADPTVLDTLMLSIGDFELIVRCAVENYAEAATALSARSDGWRDIESAPKDGTRFCAAWRDVEMGEWQVSPDTAWHRDHWCSDGDGHIEAVKWQPLPTPPETTT